MTEAEWLNCTEPLSMLQLVDGKASERKLRLFACDCCHHVRHLLFDERSKAALKVLERFADGRVSENELIKAYRSAYDTMCAIHEDANEQRWYYAGESAARAVLDAFDSDLRRSVRKVARRTCDALLFADEESRADLRRRVNSAQASSLRDILGNPFRPVRISTSLLSWANAAIPTFAQSVYAERTFENLPILADALEDAGCDNADMLAHCRGPGPHVRGCWVVDLILGKQ